MASQQQRKVTPRSPRSRHSGVTLAEVIVASALLAIAIAPLLRALTAAQVEDRAIERKSWSLLLAQQELEWIRARCIHHYDACYRVSSKAIRDGYLCTVADDGHPNLRTVTVSVGLDQDNDGVLSPGEVEVNLSTRLAR
jgi:prepilin-type N-terminal cleavage/methylation domain-containing protein